MIMHSSIPTENGSISRLDVLNELHSQTIRVRGLYSAFSIWPFAINPRVDEVRKDVARRLEE